MLCGKMTGRKTAVSRQMQAAAVKKVAKNLWRHSGFKSIRAFMVSVQL